MTLPDFGREFSVETRHISNPSFGPPTLYWVAIDDDKLALKHLRQFLEAESRDDRRFTLQATKLTAHTMSIVGMTNVGDVRLRVQMAED